MTVVMWDDERHVSGPSVAFNPSGENFLAGILLGAGPGGARYLETTGRMHNYIGRNRTHEVFDTDMMLAAG
jgi:hypothetical protein